MRFAHNAIFISTQMAVTIRYHALENVAARVHAVKVSTWPYSLHVVRKYGVGGDDMHIVAGYKTRSPRWSCHLVVA